MPKKHCFNTDIAKRMKGVKIFTEMHSMYKKITHSELPISCYSQRYHNLTATAPLFHTEGSCSSPAPHPQHTRQQPTGTEQMLKYGPFSRNPRTRGGSSTSPGLLAPAQPCQGSADTKNCASGLLSAIRIKVR